MRHAILYVNPRTKKLQLAGGDDKGYPAVLDSPKPEHLQQVAAGVLSDLSEEGWSVVGSGGTVDLPFWTLRLETGAG